VSPPIYILAGGGTGGHLYPGLAVAEQIRRLTPEAIIVFACSRRVIDRKILDPFNYAMVPQPVRPMPRAWRGWMRFVRAWRKSARLARDMISDLKPSAVLGLGGFAAAPLVRAAGRAGVRAALLNPDSVPGLANRWLAKYAEVIFTQFSSTAEHFGRRRRKVRCVGCPVRSEISAGSRDEAVRYFQLKPDRKTLLVFGASLGAASINTAIAALAGEMDTMADAWQVLHVAGPAKVHSSSPGAAKQSLLWRSMEYCMRMDLAYAAADLTLCRAGASTVAELAATGTPAVLMPYPYHRDQHQRYNALALVELGAAVMVDDQIDTASNVASLRAALGGLMNDTRRLASMRQAAGGLQKPDAAGQVARWIVAD